MSENHHHHHHHSNTCETKSKKICTTNPIELYFFVTIPDDTISTRVFGRLYLPKCPTKTLLILVHGGASNSYVWDFDQFYSIATEFAKAGYAVLTYDRPAYGRSPYLGDPKTITLSKQQAALQQIIHQVNKGTYIFVNKADEDSKKLKYKSFVLIGWSQGGRLTGTYQGRYNDPLIKAAATMGTPILVPPSTNFIIYNQQVVTPQITQGLDWIALYTTPVQGKEVFDYLPGIDPLIAQEISTVIILAPQAEILSIGTEAPLFRQWITQTPINFPIFIGGADHDFIAPAVPVIAGEVAQWQLISQAKLTTFTQINSGHEFQLHFTWPSFVASILTWLKSNEILP